MTKEIDTTYFPKAKVTPQLVNDLFQKEEKKKLQSPNLCIGFQ